TSLAAHPGLSSSFRSSSFSSRLRENRPHSGAKPRSSQRMDYLYFVPLLYATAHFIFRRVFHVVTSTWICSALQELSNHVGVWNSQFFRDCMPHCIVKRIVGFVKWARPDL